MAITNTTAAPAMNSVSAAAPRQAPAAAGVSVTAKAAPLTQVSSEATAGNLADKKDALAAAVKAPGLQERINNAEQASNKAWDRVGNPDTWKKAGVSKDDMVGIKERSEAAALKMVNGDKNSPMLGEAQYLAQASELASWAEGTATKNTEKGTGSLDQANALKDMAEGGTDYLKTRGEFLQLQVK